MDMVCKLSFDILLGNSYLQHLSIGERFVTALNYNYYFGIPAISNWKAGTGFADVYMENTSGHTHILCFHVFFNFLFIG